MSIGDDFRFLPLPGSTARLDPLIDEQAELIYAKFGEFRHQKRRRQEKHGPTLGGNAIFQMLHATLYDFIANGRLDATPNTLRTIAHEANVSRSTIAQVFANLTKAGVLKRNTKGRLSSYTLLPPARWHGPTATSSPGLGSKPSRSMAR